MTLIRSLQTADNLPAPIALGRPLGASAVALGDSITASGLNTTGTFAASWFPQMCQRSAGQIRPLGIYATGGYTIEQVRDTHLPTVLALNPRPSVAFVLAGTNSSGLGASYDHAAATAAYKTIVSSLLAAGIHPIPCLIPPRGAAVAAAVHQADAKFNGWLAGYAAQQGLMVLDFHTPLVNPATGAYVPALTFDSTHPSAAGYRLMAEYAIAQGITGMFQPRPDMSVTSQSGNEFSLIPSGYGAFQPGGTLASGWSTFGPGSTFALLDADPADGLTGKWMTVTVPSTATNAAAPTNTVSTGFSAGDRVALSARVRVSGAQAAASTWNCQAIFVGAAPTKAIGMSYIGTDLPDGHLYAEAVVPGGTTAITIQPTVSVPTSGTVVAQFADFVLRNLTTAGL